MGARGVYHVGTDDERLAANMMYEAPRVTRLGTVSELTLAHNPSDSAPGKQGPNHDGSGFNSNFSCVVDRSPGSDCSEHTP
jgi:hypothetical protein